MSLVSSDANQPTRNYAASDYYADLNFRLIPHPMRDDLVPIKDLEAIRNSVRNIIFTNHYERPFNNSFGGNIIAQLFELDTNPYASYLLSYTLKKVLNSREPRIKNVNVQVNSTRNHTISATISYEVRNTSTTDVLDVEYSFNR